MVVIVASVVVVIGHIHVTLSQQSQIGMTWCGHQITIFGLATHQMSKGVGKDNDEMMILFECGG